MQNGTGAKPVMTWNATVAKVETVGGRSIATVTLPADGTRFPAPSWWHGIKAFSADSLDNKTGDPAATVFIGQQSFRLAEIPGEGGRSLQVDVTDAKAPVAADDTVCLLCDQNTLYSMSQARVAGGH